MNTYSYIIVNQEIIIKSELLILKIYLSRYTYLKDLANIVKTIKSTHIILSKCFDKIIQKENGTHSDWVNANINTIKLLNLQLYV